jgi:hypothetical protein
MLVMRITIGWTQVPGQSLEILSEFVLGEECANRALM